MNGRRTNAPEPSKAPARKAGETRRPAAGARLGGDVLTETLARLGNRGMQRLLRQLRPREAPAPGAGALVSTARVAAGAELPPAVRQGLAPTLGDLSGVRVHTDAAADAASRALGTPAFTVGRDLFFARGAYAPGSAAGRKVLAHEAAHAVQQARAAPTAAPALGRNDAAERDAHRAVEAGRRPEFAAAEMQVMAYSPTTNPDELVKEFNAQGDEWSDRLEFAPGLGGHLFEVAAQGPAQYEFVVGVVYKLETGAERKRAVSGFQDRAGTAALDEFARTDSGRWMLTNLRNIYNLAFAALDPSEIAYKIRLDDALGRGEGRNRAEAALAAAAKRGATAEALTPEFVDPLEITDRLRLVRRMLAALRAKYGKDEEIEPAITALEADLEERFATRPGEALDFEEDARQVGATQVIVERVGRSLAQFEQWLPQPGSAAEMSPLAFVISAITEGPQAALAQLQLTLPTPGITAGMGPLEVHFLALAGRVRSAWVAALRGAAAPEGPRLLAIAEAESAALPGALDQLYLGSVASHVGYIQQLAGRVQEMTGWAKWVSGEIEAINKERDAIAEDRRKGADEADLSKRAEKVQARQETVRLSIDGIQLWEQAVRAQEAMYTRTGWAGKLAPHFIVALRSASRIQIRCQEMKTAATGGDLATLRTLVLRNRDDPDIQEFLASVPLFIAGANVLPGLVGNLLLSFGILKVASAAGSLAGRLVSAGEGASLLNVAAQVGLESITFTAVSRKLQSAVGDAPRSSFLLDLALNTGLFGALRFTGSLIHTTLTERGFEVLGWTATQATSFGLLQAFGALRFRLEAGRWVSAAELKDMTVDNLILYGLMIKPEVLPAEARAHGRFKVLETLHGKYADRLEGIEDARAQLAARIAEELKPGRKGDPAADKTLKPAADELEKGARALADEIARDPEVPLDKLKEELSNPDLPASEAVRETARELLAESFDVPPEAGLERAGGETQYTYENGATDLVEAGLEAKGVPYEEETGEDGLQTIVAEPAAGPPMVLAERAEAPKPEAAPKRRYVPSPPPKPPKPPRKRRPRSLPKGEIFGSDGRLTKQGVSRVRRFKRYRKATEDEANLAVKDPDVLEGLTREHYKRMVNRGEITGKVLPPKKNIREYAKVLPNEGPGRAPNLDQATIEFLRSNPKLMDELTTRLKDLRDTLGMPEDLLPEAAIKKDPWTAAGKLREKATVSKADPQLQRAANDFVDILSRSIGNLQPDLVLLDEANSSLTVVDPTHTVSTQFEVFHQFKTMLYARVLELYTGLPAEAVEFRSPREKRDLKIPR
jgi:hypothetical protein